MGARWRATGLRRSGLSIAALALFASATSEAQEDEAPAGAYDDRPAREIGDDAAGPWTSPEISLPEWATTVRIIRSDEPILTEPTKSAPRRGSAAREARLPLFAARGGSGCMSPWLAVGPNAWVCGEHVEITRGAPVPATTKTFAPSSDGLPFRYYFVGPDGSSGYKKLREADIGAPDVQLEKGFAVAISEERAFDGQRYGFSGNDLWIPMRDLGPARPTTFQGAELHYAEGSAQDVIPVGWVVAKSARVFSAPSTARFAGESLAQFVKVDVLEDKGTFEKFTRIGDSRWVLSKDLRHPSWAAPPEEIDADAGERWIDVELATQTLVAYEGKTPVFATLVSTGKGKQGASNATPKGTFRIWVKLASANMDNLEDENANRFYRMENVPYVQYFSKGVGLHGAYWHHGFGNVRSHGCVNLAPLDAQRLFWFTTPRLPAGWTAVLPSEHEHSNVVRVR